MTVFIMAILLAPISLSRLLLWMLAVPWLLITRRRPWQDFVRGSSLQNTIK